MGPGVRSRQRTQRLRVQTAATVRASLISALQPRCSVGSDPTIEIAGGQRMSTSPAVLTPRPASRSHSPPWPPSVSHDTLPPLSEKRAAVASWPILNSWITSPVSICRTSKPSDTATAIRRRVESSASGVLPSTLTGTMLPSSAFSNVMPCSVPSAISSPQLAMPETIVPGTVNVQSGSSAPIARRFTYSVVGFWTRGPSRRFIVDGFSGVRSSTSVLTVRRCPSVKCTARTPGTSSS